MRRGMHHYLQPVHIPLIAQLVEASVCSLMMAHTRSAVRQIKLHSLSLELLEVSDLGCVVFASTTLAKW